MAEFNDRAFSDPQIPGGVRDPLADPFAPAWTSSSRCRSWLLWGALAALLNGCLGVAGDVASLQLPNQDGFTLEEAIFMAAVIPQFVMLMALLVLAKEVESRGFWKSALGWYVCGWIIIPLSFGLDDAFEDSAGAFAALVAVAIGGLLVFLFSGLPRFSKTGQPPKAPKSQKKSSELGCGTIIAITFLLRFVLRAFRGKGLGLDSTDWLMIEFAVLALLGTVLTIWFGVAKIRLRDKLGPMAMVTGGAEILSALVWAGVVGFFAYQLYTMGANPNVDKEDIHKFIEAKTLSVMIASLVVQVVFTLLTAAFFMSVRSRSTPDWRFNFQ